ncbi:MAG: TetR/AcrR family transcriptional regulator [Sphingobacteriales bacterium]|nr:MAG: TetR/AcrR family transcriptional regulator [Sphingobacteriales bacterium]
MNKPEATTKEQQIIQKSRELIFCYGSKSLTMDDISQHLGISKKTLYQVVANKAELIDKIVQLTIDDHMDGVQCMVQGAENAIEEMLQIYRQNNAMMKKMNVSLAFELKKYFPESWEKLENFRNEFIHQSVIRNLTNGMQTGFYRDDLNIKVIATLYAVRTLDMMNTALFPPDEFPSNTILHEMFLYHLRGIASAKGLEYLEKNVVLDF